MQRKVSGVRGRPVGTDGSDFSYRMVVESSMGASPGALPPAAHSMNYGNPSRGIRCKLAVMVITHNAMFLFTLWSCSRQYDVLIVTVNGFMLGYTKVAKGKVLLYKLIITQGLIQLVGLLCLMLSVTKNESFSRLALASSSISIISFSIGGLGLSRSKVNFLKFFMFASSTALLLSMACLGRRDLFLEIIQDPSQLHFNRSLAVEIVCVVLGVLVQIFSITSTISLVQNMSPSKKAS